MALFGDLPPPASDNSLSLFDDLPPEINSSDKAEDLVDSRVNKRPSSTGAEEVEDSCSKRSKHEGKLHTQVRQATLVGQGRKGEGGGWVQTREHGHCVTRETNPSTNTQATPTL